MSEASPSAATSEASPRPGDWRTNLLLFVLTVGSVLAAGREMCIGAGLVSEEDATWLSGWPFALPFLGILVFHEFGHWIAAQLHRVPASLPYFLPMPYVLFGTFGAVITMPDRIRSRNALLDIGAAGPLAGLIVAIPTLVIGLELSEVRPVSVANYLQEGQSLLYWWIKRVVLGPMPDGHDVYLHPTAFAAWGGLLITMINLLPWGQLDGGHIAYALLGEKQNRLAPWLRRGLLLLFAYNVWLFVVPVWRGQSLMSQGAAWGNSLFWVFWFAITGIMGRLGGRDHPPCEPGELTPTRRRVAQLSLALFVLLFMPTPIAVF